MDPEGSELRKAHRLRRRIYQNTGPNYSRYCDGYDKLKPFGFPIYGCIDGWSRKIMWLYVTPRSNNQPNNVAAYFLDAVGEYCGCPVDLVTDLGTENGIIAAIQSFFRDDPDSNRYVPSPRNQRIEAQISHQTWFYLTNYALNALKILNQIHRCTYAELVWLFRAGTFLLHSSHLL